MFPSLTPSTQTSSSLFGVIGQGNNNGAASAPTSLFGVPAGGSGTSSFTFGQPSFTSLTPAAFGTPSFTTGFSLTSSSLSSTPTTLFGTPSTGFKQTSSSTPSPFGTPSFTGFSQTSSLTPSPFGTPSFTGFSQTSSSTPSPFGTPSFSPFNPSGTSPAFSSTRTTFGPSSTTGTPSPSYAPTPFVETSGGDQKKLISISAMPAYLTRSHEELQWDNYMTGKTAAPFNPFAVKSSSSSSSIFPPFSSLPANNISTTSWPSTTTSPTWNYSGPIPFTSSNTSLTATPSNSSNPFAINSIEKSTSSGFPPGSSLPVTTSWQTTTTSPNWISPSTTYPSLPSTNTTLTTDPSKSFNPFAPKTSLTSPASTFPFTPLTHNPFQIPSTSLPTQSSSSSFPSTTFPSLTSQPPHVLPSTNTTLTTDPSKSFNPFAPKTSLTSPASPFQIPSTSLPTQSTSSSFPSTTYPLKAAWPTSVHGPFPVVPAATNSVTVSPVSCELTPTHNQLSSSQITSTPAAASPFGILPPSPQLSFPRSTPIQYGISSIPVKDKPAPVRYPLMTTRHFSRGGRLSIRKYDPKLSGPKIPYYSVTSEMPNTFFVPRENPRALIITPEKSPLRENMHEEKLSGSVYEKERDGTSADTGSEDPTNDQDLFATIVDVPSKLQQPDYYTQPQISELEAKERAEPGYCRRVKDFVVGRHGYGSIKFLGETDVRKLDLETIIQFNNREVIVYLDESKKPPVGEGLNIPAEVTLLNIKCINKKTGMQCVDGSKIDRYTAMLKKKAATQGAEFLSYNAVEGEWKFKVQHF